MKRISAMVLIVLFLVNCATIKVIDIPPRPTTREYDCTIEQIYPILIKEISHYPIMKIDKENNIIVTDWRDYIDAKEIHLIEYNDFRTSYKHGIPFEARDKLVIYLEEINGKAKVNINRMVRIRPYYVIDYREKKWKPNNKFDFITVKSNTLVEERILNKLQEVLE